MKEVQGEVNLCDVYKYIYIDDFCRNVEQIQEICDLRNKDKI